MGCNYQWDSDKNALNYKKHGVHFADAVSVFFDDYAIAIDDDTQEEQRYITLGVDAFERLLVVVHTWRGNDIRIISARKANSNERKNYRRRL